MTFVQAVEQEIQAVEIEGAQLSAVMSAIRDAITEAEAHPVPGFPDLKTLNLEMQTIATRAVDAKVKIWVITLGTKLEAEETSSIILKMAPPKVSPKSELTNAEQLNDGRIKDALARAIAVAKLGYKEANQGNPKYDAAVEIRLKFTIKFEGSAGAKFDILPIGFEAGLKVGRQKIHTVHLMFG